MKIKNQSGDQQQIQSLVEEWADAVRRRDMAGVIANHSPDLVMFDVPPPFESVGLEAYRKTWDTFFAWSSGLAVFDIDDLNVTAGEDVAFVVARMRCSGRDDDGSRTELRFRLTIGLRKMDGKWTIVHEHHSIPAEK
jgi:uncharacterized protein (TIGR02246 family)